MNCEGKNIVITGAANGISFETAKTFINNGASKIAVLDIEDATAKYKALFPTKEIICLQVDVSQRQMVEDAYKVIHDKWKRIDIVVNGSGILNDLNIELTVGVNLIGTMNSTFTAMNYMSIAKGGSGGVIVNVASVCGLHTFFSIPIYTATKHGIVGLTASMSNDFYKQLTGVEFVTICPGFTDTKLVAPFSDMVAFPEAKEVTDQLLAQVPYQTAEVCAKNILNAMKESKNGSIWILIGGKYKEVEMAKYWDNKDYF